MSTPKNHHFVSQVHLKYFFNNTSGIIYLYDKERKNHYYKSSTRRIFSEDNSNTIFKDGIKDFESLENDLNLFFEKDFSKNVDIVNTFIIEQKEYRQLEEAIYYFSKYGIIGELRTPRNKKTIDDAIGGALTMIAQKSTPKLKKEIENLLSFKQEVKYMNINKYSEISESILNAMGKLIFYISRPKNKDDYFVVPDCSSISTRDKINKYFNPDIKEIASIGLPLTSKIYLSIFSEKLFQQKDVSSKIFSIDSDFMEQINKSSYDFCQSKIACESEEYIKRFVKNITK